jgi:hypothetical protein
MSLYSERMRDLGQRYAELSKDCQRPETEIETRLRVRTELLNAWARNYGLLCKCSDGYVCVPCKTRNELAMDTKARRADERKPAKLE